MLKYVSIEKLLNHLIPVVLGSRGMFKAELFPPSPDGTYKGKHRFQMKDYISGKEIALPP